MITLRPIRALRSQGNYHPNSGESQLRYAYLQQKWLKPEMMTWMNYWRLNERNLRDLGT